jgi:hypothetical protein
MNVKRLLMTAVFQVAAVLSVQVPVLGSFSNVKTDFQFARFLCHIVTCNDMAEDGRGSFVDRANTIMTILEKKIFNGADFVDRKTGDTLLHIIFTNAPLQFLQCLINQLERRQYIFFKRRHLNKKNKRGLTPFAQPKCSDDIEKLKQQFERMVVLNDTSCWCY